MTGALRIGVVPGVAPDRWVRVWRERRPRLPLEIVPVPEGGAAAALAGDVRMVFARLPIEGVDLEALHVIPLWEETPVVVAAKDHAIRVVEGVRLAELADEEVRPGWDEAVLDLVAAGHGVARMPHAVFRSTGRRDLVSRPVVDAEPTRIGLVWLRAEAAPEIDEFVGVVRGRTENSSRGAAPSPPPPPPRPPAPRRRRR